MGKKGTKRKTKWRTLPLQEEAGVSGKEEKLHEDDGQSTNSSVTGQQPASNYSRQQNQTFHKLGDESQRQYRRFSYERYRNKEPLVKLESKTFDEEEYTKITTPRQDVLFKKGYFGRKRESSSVEEFARRSEGVEGEEPMMDQIIITNGFVDERGHYLVNGNSYEIYDPYSNTVTVVVGPPPYANGITQPVLAAVSCQPVPLHPVDWYPPGSDWPSQGSAWTPSFPASPRGPGRRNADDSLNFHGPESGPVASLYQAPYVVPEFPFAGSVHCDGEVVRTNNQNDESQIMCSNGNKNDGESFATKSNGDVDGENVDEIEGGKNENRGSMENFKINNGNNDANAADDDDDDDDDNNKSNGFAVDSPLESAIFQPAVSAAEIKRENVSNRPEVTKEGTIRVCPPEGKSVEKQNHGTQTNSFSEKDEKFVRLKPDVSSKESQSTQTAPEQTFPSNNNNNNINNNINSSVNNRLNVKTQKENEKNESSNKIEAGSTRSNWKYQENRKFGDERVNISPKKAANESPSKIYQRKPGKNYVEERNPRNPETSEKSENSSPIKVSYAKKAMAGLEGSVDGNSRVIVSRTFNGKTANGIPKGNQTNGYERTCHQKHGSGEERYNACDEKKNFANGNVKNGFVKARYTKCYYGNKTGNERNNHPKESRDRRDRRVREKTSAVSTEPDKTSAETKEKYEETSQSEKSSTLSELSSPTELSSGQNTPPEKLIVKKMEEKIANEMRESFGEKLKRNLTKTEEEGGDSKDDEPEVGEGAEENDGSGVDAKWKEKTSENKKRNNGKTDVAGDKSRPATKSNRKKKKKKSVAGESKDSGKGNDNSNEETDLLPDFIIREPRDLLFETWEGIGSEKTELINSKMDSIVTGNDEILKTLGINGEKANFSKLPLHTDLLMMLPSFGWSRPKFKIEDIFAPARHIQSDLFVRRNITSMKSTRPEEFFASVVDRPSLEKCDRKKGANKNGKGDESKKTDSESDGNRITGESDSSAEKRANPVGDEETSGKSNEGDEKVEEPETEIEKKKLGIVKAVNNWLQKQENPGNVLSMDSFSVEAFEELTKSIEEREKVEGRTEVETEETVSGSKNATGNPVHALSGNADDKKANSADFEKFNECIRVANVINDGFIYFDGESFPEENRSGKKRIGRSSSLDRKSSDAKIRKHLKFLRESASFCQDLISDVRNGFPAKSEYATEELCDSKQSVLKYYTLSPSELPVRRKREKGAKNGERESDSENEAFDALEYKFLTRENVGRGEGDGIKMADGTGNASVTDSGVLSDVDSTEDAANDAQNKDATCKLQ